MKLSTFFQHACYILVITVFFFYIRDREDQMGATLSFLRATQQADDLRINEQWVAIKQWEDVVQEDRIRFEKLLTLVESQSQVPQPSPTPKK